MVKKILITDKVHDLLINGLRNHDFKVKYEPDMTYDEVLRCAASYHGIIINSKVKCDKRFLNSTKHLDFIGRLGSGLDIIDLQEASNLGIEIISSPEGNANAVGEHCLGMLLSLLHNIGNAHTDLRSLSFNREPNRGIELSGKKIGIIGFGHTGPAFADKLSGLDVDIYVYDKYRSDMATRNPSVTILSLSQLLEKSDVVSIHLPLTDETSSLVDTSFIQNMKKGAIVINTSRGDILESQALLAALKTGHLSGACLDVLENEKPETWTSGQSEVYQELLVRKDVIITPHIAGWTHRSLQLIASILLEKICKFYRV